MIFAMRLDPSSMKWQHFTVAESEGELIGMAQVKPYPDCREFGSLAVRHEWRKQGIGAMLIEDVLSREAGDVYLVCRSTLAPYYRKFGFADIAFGDAPRTLKLKLGAAFPFRLFGVRVVAMVVRRT
jgi:N-acetylglutamate synthase-like GNAT family acetyltransferase